MKPVCMLGSVLIFGIGVFGGYHISKGQLSQEMEQAVSIARQEGGETVRQEAISNGVAYYQLLSNDSTEVKFVWGCLEGSEGDSDGDSGDSGSSGSSGSSGAVGSLPEDVAPENSKEPLTAPPVGSKLNPVKPPKFSIVEIQKD